LTKPGLARSGPIRKAIVSLITWHKFFNASKSARVPLPWHIFSSCSCNRLLPTRQGAHLPHDSSTVNSR
jgi:hypothetical protein